eukprot:317761-Rhodomonas_salina.1
MPREGSLCWSRLRHRHVPRTVPWRLREPEHRLGRQLRPLNATTPKPDDRFRFPDRRTAFNVRGGSFHRGTPPTSWLQAEGSTLFKLGCRPRRRRGWSPRQCWTACQSVRGNKQGRRERAEDQDRAPGATRHCGRRA